MALILILTKDSFYYAFNVHTTVKNQDTHLLTWINFNVLLTRGALRVDVIAVRSPFRYMVNFLRPLSRHTYFLRTYY